MGTKIYKMAGCRIACKYKLQGEPADTLDLEFKYLHAGHWPNNDEIALFDAIAEIVLRQLNIRNYRATLFSDGNNTEYVHIKPDPATGRPERVTQSVTGDRSHPYASYHFGDLEIRQQKPILRDALQIMDTLQCQLTSRTVPEAVAITQAAAQRLCTAKHQQLAAMLNEGIFQTLRSLPATINNAEDDLDLRMMAGRITGLILDNYLDPAYTQSTGLQDIKRHVGATPDLHAKQWVDIDKGLRAQLSEQLKSEGICRWKKHARDYAAGEIANAIHAVSRQLQGTGVV